MRAEPFVKLRAHPSRWVSIGEQVAMRWKTQIEEEACPLQMSSS
jgi:hypothetical protein